MPHLVLVHGNLSDARAWTRLVAALPPTITATAINLAGFGGSALPPGGGDAGILHAAWADAVLSAAREARRSHERVVLVGWSLGGYPVLTALKEIAAEVAGVVLVAPVAPSGFGGSKGLDRHVLTMPDGAGSGGGAMNPHFVEAVRRGDRGPDGLPRATVRSAYVAPGAQLAIEDEELLLDGLLAVSTDPAFFPGDTAQSPNWPFVAPGRTGSFNALSPVHMSWWWLPSLETKPPILWVRGTRDVVVADGSAFDFAVIGAAVPDLNWPGADVYPPQPMVTQTRNCLRAYSDAGGHVVEEVLEGCGHSPMIEAPDALARAIAAFI